MIQQGQVFKLKTKGPDGQPLWAYRYRLEGRGSERPQVGGFATQGEARRHFGRCSTDLGRDRLPRHPPLPPVPWRPAQKAAGIDPLRWVYDLRHTFATFALRAGISTFELSRYMGASLTMIDRHYSHLARDGREHAIKLLDVAQRIMDAGGRSVDVETEKRRQARQRQPGDSRLNSEAL